MYPIVNSPKALKKVMDNDFEVDDDKCYVSSHICQGVEQDIQLKVSFPTSLQL